MKPFVSALLLIASSFALGPAASLAQVPDSVQAEAPQAQVGRSQTLRAQMIADERVSQIESTRSDIADLSKFEHGNEYLPKSIYKRNYVENRDSAPMIADHQKPNSGDEHHM